MGAGTPQFGLNEITERFEKYWKDARIGFREEGVFLELPPSWNLRDDVSMRYLKTLAERKGIAFVSDQILNAIKSGKKDVLLCGPKDELPVGEEAFVAVSSDKMEAYLILIPPDEGGSRLSPATLMIILRNKYGVTTGLDADAAKLALETGGRGGPVIVARGMPPVNGKDAYLEFLFARDKTSLPVARGDDEKIDYHQLDLFENVVKDQLLVRKHPATKGDGGINVLGEIIPALPGRDVPPPVGKNCELRGDGTELYSTIDGQVEYINRRVIVSNVLPINRDVDLSTGDIDFNGDVIVYGNVISGMNVVAAGSIEVKGSVEAATLCAGGSIMLHRGMQGMDVGSLSAGGSIVSMFIERARVEAEGSVTADSLLHCNILCKDSIICRGRRGIIVGGNIRAQNIVSAGYIGTEAAVSTRIEVGIIPGIRERGLEIEQEIWKCQEEIKKCDTILKTLPSYNIEPAKRVMLTAQTKQTKNAAMSQLAQIQLELADIVQIMENTTQGKVHVRGAVFPGSVISIGAVQNIIKSKIQFATFKLVNGHMTFGAYEED